MSEQDNVSRGEITQEVVETLVSFMAQVIGQSVVDIVLRQLPADEQPSGRDLVYRLAEETDKLLGSTGAYAVLRQIGRDLAKQVASTLPKDQWHQALEQSLNNFGFADRIEKCDGHSNICNCAFYEILEGKNLVSNKHPVCWLGWGFIEGFMKLMEGVKGIKWVRRDLERKACKFDYIK